MESLPTKINFPVIEEGQEVVRPDVMSAVVQLAQLAQLTKIRKLEESKVPVGIKPLKRTVTDTIMELPLYPPWISFSLINDGSNALTVWVNSEEDPLIEDMIASGETYNLDAKYPIIRTLYLKSETGTSNQVRIYGKEGKQI